MALIKCTECGKEVSDRAATCPNCGCPIGREEKVKNKPEEVKNFAKNYKKPIIAVIAILIVAISIISMTGSRLNKDEQLVYECAVELREMMRDPDSFKLYDDTFIIERYDDAGALTTTYTVIEYGGANGYGGMTTDQAIFVDGEYVMDFSYEFDDSEPLDESGEKVMIQFALATYMNSGDDENQKTIDIDVEKIKDKMGL